MWIEGNIKRCTTNNVFNPLFNGKSFYETLLTPSILTEMCLNTFFCRDVNLDMF